jgi:hypothetical protein
MVISFSLTSKVSAMLMTSISCFCILFQSDILPVHKIFCQGHASKEITHKISLWWGSTPFPTILLLLCKLSHFFNYLNSQYFLWYKEMPDSNSLENHITSKIVYPTGDDCLANIALAACNCLCPLNHAGTILKGSILT